MITRILILFSTFFFLSAFQAQEFTAEGRIITFLQVDLVCGAASDIGCGSRSKPILMDLECKSEIAEAWLNRPGTIIAVVWNDNLDSNETLLKQTLKEHRKSGKVLGQNESIEQKEKFRTDRWYRTNEVDELSIEEAGRIAEMVISTIKEQGSLSDTHAPMMQNEIEAYLKNELLSLEDVNLLNKRSYYKSWESGIKNIAKPYMDQSEIDKIHLFVMSPWIKYFMYGAALASILLIT